MGQVVFAVCVVRVVGGEKRRFEFAGNFDELRVGLLLGWNSLILNLDEQVVASEDLLESSGP